MTAPCAIAEAVASDIRTRAEVGLRKYGVTLERTDLNRREWLQHAYEEALDLACYLRRLIALEDVPERTMDIMLSQLSSKIR